MQRLVRRGLGVQLPLVLGHHREQLAVDVAPFTHAADVDEVLSQQLLVLSVGQLVGVTLPAPRIKQPLPQGQVTRELALFVVELRMLLVGLGLGLHRPIAHVLHRQGRGHHQHLAKRAATARLQDHAAHPRIQRQAGQFAADVGQLVGLVHRPQLAQKLVAVGDGAPLGRLQEGELLHRPQAQRLHAQDHAGQRGAQDLGVGKARTACEIFLVVQADADAIGHPPAAARALVGGGLADRLDQQLFDLAAKAVSLHTRGAGVDHIADARHRQRGLGHVGGQHDAPSAMRLEDAVLFRLRQAGEQRQHLGAAQHRAVRQMTAQVVGGLTDLALARQENQDIAAHTGTRAAPEFIHRIGNRLVQAVIAAVLKRPPTLFDREGAARDIDHRGRHRLLSGAGCGHREVPCKALGIDGGRGHDHLQIGAPG